MNNREKNISLQKDEIEIDLADMFAELKHCWILLFMEMLQSRHFEDILKALREQFDYVILDAPSLGSVVDASVISQKVDGTVFVVCSDAVGRDEAQRAVKQLEKSGGRILGVALNGVGTHKGEYYYKYKSSYKNYYHKE